MNAPLKPSRRSHHSRADRTRSRSSHRDIAPDCRHYRGDRPCVYNRLCRDCEHYAPYSHRICIIKLGALGDVIRTLCILPELRRRHPDAHITWVSRPNGCRMISDHPMIDRVLPFDPICTLPLQHESFDLLINLDKEPHPCALAMAITAKRKQGIALSEHGTPVPFERRSEHYFQMGLSDELKFCHNDKSYQQLVYEAMGWDYAGQRYELPLNESAADRMRLRLASMGWKPGVHTVGVFVGAGRAFANKMWPAARTADVIRELKSRATNTQVLLLGGPGERRVIDQVMSSLHLSAQEDYAIDTGTEHDEQSFVALVDMCDVVVCGDTMAMHVAVALGKGVVAFFGPTCEQEIDLFGRGEKLVADVPCGPCYTRVCDQNDICTTQVEARTAVDAVVRVLDRVSNNEVSLPVLPDRKAG